MEALPPALPAQAASSRLTRYSQSLALLNLGTSVALILAAAALARFENALFFLAGVFLLCLLLGLAVLSFPSALYLAYKKSILNAALVAASAASAITLSAFITPYAAQLARWGTPADPNTFLTPEKRTLLASVAHQLTGQSFRHVSLVKVGPPHVQMVHGPAKALPEGVEDVLRENGFSTVRVDDTQSLVVFGHYSLRTWFEYLYTPEPFPPLFERPVKITEGDIEDWWELVRIARQGPSATKEQRRTIVFRPGVAYPTLMHGLGKDAMAEISRYSSPDEITPDQKARVLEILNDQRLVKNRLIENPNVTFDQQEQTLVIGGGKLSDRFWVVTLVRRLLEQGVLSLGTEGRRLEVRSDLTPDEERELEWVHVGLIEFLYGNLVSKPENAYKRTLGDGWYFNSF